MWIDIGAKDKKDAEKLVQVGDPAVLAYRPDELQNGLLVSRAMDDRAGAFVVLEAARLLSKMDINAEVFAVATVQEEVGLRGAATSAYALDPQVGIAVDVTFGTDFPSMSKRDGEITLGKGPVIARGPNINPRLFELFTKTAKKHKIDYQLEGAPRGTGTDANRIQLTRAGVSTGLISIPNRYMHSPCEVVSISDLENSAKLIANTVAAIGPRTDFKVKLT
jgi:endoglucanase